MLSAILGWWHLSGTARLTVRPPFPARLFDALGLPGGARLLAPYNEAAFAYATAKRISIARFNTHYGPGPVIVYYGFCRSFNLAMGNDCSSAGKHSTPTVGTSRTRQTISPVSTKFRSDRALGSVGERMKAPCVSTCDCISKCNFPPHLMRNLIQECTPSEPSSLRFTQSAQSIRGLTSAQVHHDLKLQIGAIAEGVKVSANSIQLNTGNAAVGRIIENKRTIDLPINGRRMVGLDVLIRGVQFRERTGRGDGLGGGANVQITIKSGNNNLHGMFFDLVRNDIFDAENYHLNFERSANLPRLRPNQFGFGLSGPVLIPKIYNGKNQTFWTFNMASTVRWGCSPRTSGCSVIPQATKPTRRARSNSPSSCTTELDLTDRRGPRPFAAGTLKHRNSLRIGKGAR